MSRIWAIAVCLIAVTWSATASAHDFQVGTIKVDHPWARATPPGAPVAGGYLTLTNSGSQPDRLVSVKSELSADASVHDMRIKDGVASMQPVENGLELGAAQSVELKPGGLHIMFMKPTKSLKKGDKFKAVLVFEKAGSVEVEFVVQGMGTKAAEDAMDHDMPMGQPE